MSLGGLEPPRTLPPAGGKCSCGTVYRLTCNDFKRLSLLEFVT